LIVCIVIAVIAGIVYTKFIGKDDDTNEKSTESKKTEANYESAIEDYCKAFSEFDAEKIVKTIDVVGAETWYIYDLDDLDNFDEDDYDDFIEEYEEEKEYVDLDELKEEIIEDLEDEFEYMEDEYKSFNLKVEEFKEVEKLGNDLYAVEVKLEMKAKDEYGEEFEETETLMFIVYKDKIIYTEI